MGFHELDSPPTLRAIAEMRCVHAVAHPGGRLARLSRRRLRNRGAHTTRLHGAGRNLTVAGGGVRGRECCSVAVTFHTISDAPIALRGPIVYAPSIDCRHRGS